VFLVEPLPELANEWLALFLFVSAAITDAIDGYLARKMGLVTNFGKLMDPLADKLLVCAAIVAYAAVGLLPAWAVIVLISREFYISGLRQLALEKNIVMAATSGGKIKTTFQMILIIYILLPWPFSCLVFAPVTLALLIITVVASVWSALDYTLKNMAVFDR